MSLKGANSPTRGRRLRSTGTKARARVSNGPNSLIELKKQLEARTRELAEALEQQTATSEVLGVISSSPGELQPVFDAMLEKATRVCEANFGMMFQFGEGTARPVALFGVPQAYAELAQRGGHVSEHAPVMRVARTKQMVHVADFTNEHAYAVERHPMAVAGAEIAGIRTLLLVPMIKHSELIGAIAIYRQEVRPFTDRQIALLQNFASQAVIAIENTRLLNELRQRTDDLTEALEQQAATSEVLGVISSSPGELEPVFQAMLANATRLCEARLGILYRYDNGCFTQRLWLARRPLLPISFGNAVRLYRLSVPHSTAFYRQRRWSTPSTKQKSKSRYPGLHSWARDLISTSQCSKTTGWSASSPSGVRRCGRSPTSKSSWSKISLSRPS